MGDRIGDATTSGALVCVLVCGTLFMFALWLYGRGKS
jgi:hypothetical protein